VDLFKDYAVDGAELEFLVIVTNQFGPHKVSIYGFGKFPEKYNMMFGFDESAEEAIDKGEESLPAEEAIDKGEESLPAEK
jgi:hypothetical protein